MFHTEVVLFRAIIECKQTDTISQTTSSLVSCRTIQNIDNTLTSLMNIQHFKSSDDDETDVTMKYVILRTNCLKSFQLSGPRGAPPSGSTSNQGSRCQTHHCNCSDVCNESNSLFWSSGWRLFVDVTASLRLRIANDVLYCHQYSLTDSRTHTHTPTHTRACINHQCCLVCYDSL
jgi:hypothetical protein